MKIIKNICVIVFILFFIRCQDRMKNIERLEYISNGHGIVIKKYINDTIVSIIDYQNDSVTMDGLASHYLHNKLEKTEYWNEGVKIGKSIIYKNGIPYVFVCYDSNGDTVFIRKFEGRNIEFDTGQILPHGTLYVDKQSSKKTAYYYGFIIKPPYSLINVSCLVINLNNRDTILPTKLSIDYEWIYTYTFQLDDFGSDYKIIRTVTLVDSLISIDKKITAIDTQVFRL